MITGVDSVKLADVISFIGLFFGAFSLAVMGLPSASGDPFWGYITVFLWSFCVEGFAAGYVFSELNIGRCKECST